MKSQEVIDSYIGNKYNKLTITKYSHNKDGHYYYECTCECGRVKVICISNILKEFTRSCGCMFKTINITHGMRHTRLYNIWAKMQRRCLNKNDNDYYKYGERGISVCLEWRTFIPFGEWAMNNGYQESLTIDRINNDGDYEPSNCRWATYKQQGNNKRNSFFIEYNGEKLTSSEWDERLGFKRKTVWTRIKILKWDSIKAITTPISW